MPRCADPLSSGCPPAARFGRSAAANRGKARRRGIRHHPCFSKAHDFRISSDQLHRRDSHRGGRRPGAAGAAERSPRVDAGAATPLRRRRAGARRPAFAQTAATKPERQQHRRPAHSGRRGPVVLGRRARSARLRLRVRRPRARPRRGARAPRRRVGRRGVTSRVGVDPGNGRRGARQPADVH